MYDSNWILCQLRKEQQFMVYIFTISPLVMHNNDILNLSKKFNSFHILNDELRIVNIN